MNAITVYGKVTSKPVFVPKARASTLDFIVVITRPSKRPGGSGADFIPVHVYGSLAEEVKDIEYGDRALIHGRLRVERNGICSISAHDIWLPDYEEDTHGGRPQKEAT